MNQDLDFTYAEIYFKAHNVEFSEDKFVALGLKNKDNIYTKLGELVSDDNPIVVKFACYDNFLHFKYKKEFTGSIIKITNEVLTEAELFNVTSAKIPEKGGRRIETKSFPGYSLREAILNAICHADYSAPSNIIIAFYKDRMEVTNPGGIYHYELIDILHGAQSFRNPKLVNILNKLSFIENYAEGIKRIREAYPDYDVISFFSGSSLWFRTTLPDLNYVKYGDKPIDGPKMAPMNEPKKFCINRWSN